MKHVSPSRERVDGDERRRQADTRRAVRKALRVCLKRSIERLLADGGVLVHASEEDVCGREERDAGMMMAIGEPVEIELAVCARVHEASNQPAWSTSRTIFVLRELCRLFAQALAFQKLVRFLTRPMLVSPVAM